MGFLRLILALSVVCAHVGYSGTLVGGPLAVQLFFLISGFVISAVLMSGRYPSVSAFYRSRALRIFPAFWAVALVMVALRMIEGSRLGEFSHLGSAMQAALAFSNVAIIGQDAVFLNYDLGRFLLLPQGWSLSVELIFYLAAPFLIPRRWSLWALLIGGFVLGSVIETRLFPVHCWLFAAGALAQQTLKRLSDQRASVPALTGIFALLLLHPVIQSPLLLIFAMVVALPAIAPLRTPAEEWAGALSYPLYLVHWPVLLVTKETLSAPLVALATIAVSIIASALLLYTVVLPVEAFRLQIRKSRPVPAAA